MLDFIYHMTLKIIKNYIFGVKISRFSLKLSIFHVDDCFDFYRVKIM